MAWAGGPMKTRPARRTAFGKIGVFRQETVSGMDRLGRRLPGGFQQAIDVQIALPRFRRTQVDGFIGLQDMERRLIRLGIRRPRF